MALGKKSCKNGLKEARNISMHPIHLFCSNQCCPSTCSFVVSSQKLLLCFLSWLPRALFCFCAYLHQVDACKKDVVLREGILAVKGAGKMNLIDAIGKAIGAGFSWGWSSFGILFGWAAVNSALHGYLFELLTLFIIDPRKCPPLPLSLLL